MAPDSTLACVNSSSHFEEHGDVDNEWFMPEVFDEVLPVPTPPTPAPQDTAAVGGSMDVLPGVPGSPPTGSGIEIAGSSSSVLIMAQPGLIANAIQHHADARNTQELYIDVTTAEAT